MTNRAAFGSGGPTYHRWPVCSGSSSVRGARVAEAAQAVGFYDESQLHRHFRRIVGVPPGVYAQELRLLRTNAPTSPKASGRRRRILAA